MTIHLLNRLQEEFRQRAKSSDILFLLSPSDALQFLERAHQLGLELAGIDGFRITEQGGFQPCQEHSNDITDSNTDRETFYRQTRDFIRQRLDSGIWFQLIFEAVE
jgi:hypothetical protein